MSKLSKVLIGSAAVGAVAIGVAVVLKVLCNNKEDKYVSSTDKTEEFVEYVTSPEDNGGETM